MFLDISAGLIFASLINLAAEEFNPLLIVFGVLTVLAPDIDFVIYCARKRLKRQNLDRFAYEHRDILHYPVIIILIPAIALMLFHQNEQLIAIWVLTTSWHFIHDTFDKNGWGIRWFWPLNEWYITLHDSSPSLWLLNKEEQRKAAEKFGDPDWLREEYYRAKRQLAIGIIVSVPSLIFLISSTLVLFDVIEINMSLFLLESAGLN